MSDDTISRKATIEAMEDVDWYHINKDGQLTHGANSKDNEPLYKAKDVYKVLNDMPSAQPETHDKRTKTHSCDCISRQAIEILADEEKLPSVQPDLSGYSDKLWQKAYERGKAEAQQRWIPCSERLPEKEEQVLIYAWNVHYVLAKYREIRTCDGVYKMAWVTEDAYSTPREIKYEVICWMPLPEPYQAERRTDERSD